MCPRPSACTGEPRISPDEARLLIEDATAARLALVSLGPDGYRTVMRPVEARGLGSGVVYDALQAECARKERVNRILTYNLSDFARFELGEIVVAAP